MAHEITGLQKRTRSELIRIILEMQSERDAAKSDVLRAIESRNAAIDEAAALRAQLARAG
jgi:hypothetical protein